MRVSVRTRAHALKSRNAYPPSEDEDEDIVTTCAARSVQPDIEESNMITRREDQDISDNTNVPSVNKINAAKITALDYKFDPSQLEAVSALTDTGADTHAFGPKCVPRMRPTRTQLELADLSRTTVRGRGDAFLLSQSTDKDWYLFTFKNTVVMKSGHNLVNVDLSLIHI